MTPKSFAIAPPSFETLHFNPHCYKVSKNVKIGSMLIILTLTVITRALINFAVYTVSQICISTLLLFRHPSQIWRNRCALILINTAVFADLCFIRITATWSLTCVSAKMWVATYCSSAVAERVLASNLHRQWWMTEASALLISTHSLCKQSVRLNLVLYHLSSQLHVNKRCVVHSFLRSIELSAFLTMLTQMFVFVSSPEVVRSI